MAMEHDYYAFRQAQLSNSLSELEQAAEKFEQAKGQKEARQQAKGKMEQAANKAVKIEPHLAYLWYEASASEPDNSIRDAWQKTLAANAIPEVFRAVPNSAAIVQMPPLSFLVHIPFRLQKPYLSKDERSFYLLDNPLRKEKIFQTPMIAATGWKGALRAALWQLGYKEDHEAILRLFGNPRGSEEGQAGRLHFYSSFFDKISLEVINPHNRATGVGERGPILMECVPQGTIGDLVLLYVPFGPIGQSEADRRAEIAQDLEVLTEGIQAMLTIYGFGAKTSSGFGIADERLPKPGTLSLRAELPGFAASTEPSASGVEEAQAEIAQFVARQGLSEFPHWTKKELEQSNWGAKKQSEYKRLRRRHPDWDDQSNVWRAPVEEAAPARSQMPAVTTGEFDTLSKLRDLAQRAATQLRNGGEA
jgi:CRISPR-associated protein Cmr2